jgi:hypothetical protein
VEGKKKNKKAASEAATAGVEHGKLAWLYVHES